MPLRSHRRGTTGHRRGATGRRTFALLGVLLLLLGNSRLFAADASPGRDADLVWPRPPAQARIRYARSVATPADWGITPGILARLTDWMTGSTPLRFVRPASVAVRNKILYVADPGTPAFYVLDAERNDVHKVQDVGGRPLLSPVSVATGPADTVFFADSALVAVFQLDRSGQPVRTIQHAELKRPAAVAYDAARDRLYVADSQAHRIVVFSAAGEMRQAFGKRGSGDGEFNAPTHLAVTRDGNLLVTDALNHRVQAFDPAGRFLWKFGDAGDGAGSFAAPKGVAADNGGRIYVSDAIFDAVQIFQPDGTLLLGFGQRGTGPGQFSLPGGIAFDDRGVLYVADSYNHRIQLFERVRAPGAAADE